MSLGSFFVRRFGRNARAGGRGFMIGLLALKMQFGRMVDSGCVLLWVARTSDTLGQQDPDEKIRRVSAPRPSAALLAVLAICAALVAYDQVIIIATCAIFLSRCAATFNPLALVWDDKPKHNGAVRRANRRASLPAVDGAAGPASRVSGCDPPGPAQLYRPAKHWRPPGNPPRRVWLH